MKNRRPQIQSKVADPVKVLAAFPAESLRPDLLERLQDAIARKKQVMATVNRAPQGVLLWAVTILENE